MTERIGRPARLTRPDARRVADSHAGARAASDGDTGVSAAASTTRSTATPHPVSRMMVRAVAVDARRLGSDRALLAALALTVLPLVSTINLLGDAEHLSSPLIVSALRDALTQIVLIDGVLFAAGFAAVRTARSRAIGVLARDCVALGRLRPLVARALASMIGGAVICAVVACAVCLATAAAAPTAATWAVVGPAAVLGAAAGLWGASLGVLVPSPLIVLAAVAATLSPSLLLASAAEQASHGSPTSAVAATARMLEAVSPLGSALTAAGHPLSSAADLVSSGAPTGAFAGLVALAWLVVAAVVAATVHTRRSVIA